MKILIAIITCHRFKDRADVLRRTWVQDVPQGVDVRFFLGGDRVETMAHEGPVTAEGCSSPFPSATNGHVGNSIPVDEVWLNCKDDYKSLRWKTQLAFKWAVHKEYDFIFKTDDDVYVIPDRLLKTDFQKHDYAGRVRAPSRENDAPRIYGPSETAFCSGFGYWLSQRAAKIVAYAPDNQDWAEDRFCGNVLVKFGITPRHDPGFTLWPPISGHACGAPLGVCQQCIAQYNTASVICPYERPNVIETIHTIFKSTGHIPVRLP